MKIALPYIGDYTGCLPTIFGDRHEYFVTPPNKRTIELGVTYSPEFICYPYKIILGNFIENIEKGATDIIHFQSMPKGDEGACRLRYYATIQKLILDRFNVRLHVVRMDRLIGSLKDITGFSRSKIIDKIGLTFSKVISIDQLQNIFYHAAVNKHKKRAILQLKKQYKRKIENARNVFSLVKLNYDIKRDFARYLLQGNHPKVCIYGEFYVVIESNINHDIGSIFNNLGVKVDMLTQFSRELVYDINKAWHIDKWSREAGKYAEGHMGGHALNNLVFTKKAGEKYDGAVHIIPFGCMPETSARPIMQRAAKDNKVNLLSLSLDEQTGKAGFETRIEAFTDMIKMQRGIS